MYSSEMESNPEQKVFTCGLCDLQTPFTYYGQKPPNTRSIILLEECYVTKDPFSPERERFLVLGSHCSNCNSSVCVGTDCSLFYTRRFCMTCVTQNQSQLPPQIQVELSKKQSRSTMPKTVLPTGQGGPAPPPLTNAEEMVLSPNAGRPVAEGIPGGTSSEQVTPEDLSAFIKYSHGNICLLEPPVPTEPQAFDDEETVSAATEAYRECGRTAGGRSINFWCTDEHSSVIYSKCHSFIL